MTKVLGRPGRKALQALASHFGGLGDLARWRQSALEGTARLALALTGDLGDPQ